MRIQLQELNNIIADFVQVGYMEAVKAYEPTQDLIRVADVKAWLKIMKIDHKRFDKLVKMDMIKPRRKGTGKNSPFYYSKKEIKQAFAMANISSLIAKDELDKSYLPQ